MGIKKPGSSRRKFIKSASALTGAAFATAVGVPFDAVIIASEGEKKEGPWYGYGIDIKKCIGCGNCAKACKIENDVPDKPFYFRTWIEKYTIENDGSVHVESPNGGIDGSEQKIPDENIFKSFFVPKLCNHCTNSPCEQVCPVGATYISPEGIVLIDDSYCIGCRYCIQACPYGCRYIHPERKVVDKCTMCFHRIKNGMDPACVGICPTGARKYGDLRDKDGEMVEFLRTHNCLVLRPHLNTRPKLYYNDLSAEVK